MACATCSQHRGERGRWRGRGEDSAVIPATTKFHVIEGTEVLNPQRCAHVPISDNFVKPYADTSNAKKSCLLFISFPHALSRGSVVSGITNTGSTY